MEALAEKKGNKVDTAQSIDGKAVIKLNPNVADWNPIPKNMRHEITNKVGSFGLAGSRDTFRALTAAEERFLLPVIIGKQANEQGFIEALRDYWIDWEFTPTEQGIILDYSYIVNIVKDINGNPVSVRIPNNLDQFIDYVMLSNHPWIANNKERRERQHDFKFILNDVGEERKEKESVYELKEQADIIFSTLVADMKSNREKILWILNLLKDRTDDYVTEEMSDIELRMKLRDKAQADLVRNQKGGWDCKFVEIATDEMLEEKAVVTALLNQKLITQEGNTYFYGSVSMGVTIKETIAYLYKPENSETLVKLKSQLK